MDDDFAGCFLTALFLAALFGVAIGASCQLHVTRESMAAAGVAEWQIDSKTGDKRFVYVKGGANHD